MTNTSPHPARRTFTDSMFNMWRAVIGVAHADGVVHEKERALFDKVLDSVSRAYDVPAEQKFTFTKDLAQKQDIEPFVAGIADPECKALLLFFAQIVASVDGTLAYDEAALVGKLHERFGLSPDTADRVAEIRRDIAGQMKNRREDLEKNHKIRNPIYYALDALLLRLGVDPVEP